MWLQQGAQQPQPSNGTAGVLQQPPGAYGGNTFGTGQPTAAASPFVMAPQQHHHHQQYHPHASNAPPQNYPQAGYYATAPPGATQPQMIYAGAPGQPNFSAMPTTANATASSPYHVLPQQSAYPGPGATATQAGYYAAAPGPHHHHHQPQYVAMTHSPTSGNNNAAHTTFVSHAGHHMPAQAGMLPPQQYYVAQPTPQQQQQQANPHMQPQPTSQPQVVYLPNGQFAVVLQPPPGSSAPSPSNMMSTSYPSPARVGPPGANGSLTVLPSGSSGGMTPTNIVVAGSSQSQLTMPMFVSPSVGNPPLEPGSGAGSPGGSTSRTPAQLGASLHNASSSATRPQSDPAQWGYAVVDPYHTALQRVPVPPSVVQPTRGTQTYNNDVSLSSTKPCTSHVCLRYITPAGCPLGENCASFHVAGTYIDISRGTTDPLCCGLHNDYFTQEMMRAGCAPHMPDSKFTLVLDDRSEVELLPAQLAFTVGLEQLSIRGNSRIIHIRKQVCRLHLDGRCKWTKDCGHVHLCRELHRLLSTFHYPSLVFLLSTETDDEKLSLKLNEVKEFIRSRSCMPLTHQLINTKRAAAVAAMCRVGALFTPEMALAAESQCGIQVPAEMVIAPTDFAVEAIHPERRAKYNHQAVAPSAVPTPTTTGPSGPTAPMLQLDVLAADAPRTSHSQHGAIGDLGYSASPNA